MAGFNLKDEKEVEKYLENLGIEYRFGCYSEKKPEVCHLLGDYFEAVTKDFEKAAKMYRVNCESYKHGHSCLKSGNYSYLGKGGMKQSQKKALESYDLGCSYKHAESCLHAGLIRTSGDVGQVPRDPKKAHDNFSTGCAMNNPLSCFYLSGMYLMGIEDFMQKDMEKAFSFTSKACDLGNVYACANLSQMYQRGEGVAQNEAKAAHYKKIAMEMQDELVKNFQSIKFGEGG